MGWCSGTEIFDDITGMVIDQDLEDDEKQAIIKRLVISLENGDWDCQSDSEYYDHPLVRKIFKELHPDWFEDENILPDKVYLLTVKHNDEDTIIKGVFSTKEKAIEARNYLEEDFPETPYKIIETPYKIIVKDFNPALDSL